MEKIGNIFKKRDESEEIEDSEPISPLLESIETIDPHLLVWVRRGHKTKYPKDSKSIPEFYKQKEREMLTERHQRKRLTFDSEKQIPWWGVTYKGYKDIEDYVKHMEPSHREFLNPFEMKRLNEIGFKFYNLIGRGNYAQVWLCEVTTDGFTDPYGHPINIGTKMACKKLSIKDIVLGKKDIIEGIKGLANELDVHKLVHPNLIHTEKIYRYYAEKTLFPKPVICLIFMELCDGNLSDLINKYKMLNVITARKWMIQIVHALVYLHENSVAHLDIKPENILYKLDPSRANRYLVKLCDFGFAQILGPTESESRYGGGTPLYKAPEVSSLRAYDPFKADVFSLGITLAISMTGYFKGIEYIFHIIRNNPSFMSLWNLFAKMLDINPVNRLSMKDVLEEEWCRQWTYHPGYWHLQL